ncbi:hypothetical protein PGSY75_0814100 [Plasmodium gaboni]|uniref:Uncharacterized protein n=1 Tax=Plasmodium gaboni TaxID=647221 RepID=A0A151LNG5_9APIC|nr:hypothetical protein PGSY75_0814100 [Plasmodium gaboni]XP_028537849.1 conserved Plasmodium protein, unknown function [Plasmodium sp. gorilla clade G2]SOV22223.1 conserved Plasmodium protein, unknown function [Plasmodium sp. DRC-Itaito]KYO00735.1 hypothetical protein PGSY75_0814100 [Plasmodium gaboni]SOV13445.1 conserved Plasmodium protein, unknown function [Plasmodium gaboni]SOV13611.1 conserved Plasmodium protein, unknown function [Plasmodium sp. gorilla clade G2]
MVKKDNIWVLCKLYLDEKNTQLNKLQEDDIFKIIQNSNTPLSVLIKEEFDKNALIFYGKIFKTILFNRFNIIFANLELRIFIIKTSNKFKKEIEILTKFVTVCDYLKVEILYIGVTLNKCKGFLTDLFIKLKIEENIPCIMKEFENCS